MLATSIHVAYWDSEYVPSLITRWASSIAIAATTKSANVDNVINDFFIILILVKMYLPFVVFEILYPMKES